MGGSQIVDPDSKGCHPISCLGARVAAAVRLCNVCREEASGEGVGAKMAKALDGKDYQLVITGHSLGAGTAALIGLKLKDRFPGLSPQT